MYGVQSLLAWFGVAVGLQLTFIESSIALAIKSRAVNVCPLLMAASASVFEVRGVTIWEQHEDH